MLGLGDHHNLFKQWKLIFLPLRAMCGTRTPPIVWSHSISIIRALSGLSENLCTVFSKYNKCLRTPQQHYAHAVLVLHICLIWLTAGPAWDLAALIKELKFEANNMRYWGFLRLWLPGPVITDQPTWDFMCEDSWKLCWFHLPLCLAWWRRSEKATSNHGP